MEKECNAYNTSPQFSVHLEGDACQSSEQVLQTSLEVKEAQELQYNYTLDYSLLVRKTKKTEWLNCPFPHMERLRWQVRNRNAPDDEEMVEYALKTLSELGITDFSYQSVLATPLVEVLSISIQSNHERFGDGKPVELYGTIQIANGKGTSTYIYNRDWNEPETLSIGGTLLLTTPKGSSTPIKPFGGVMMNVDLKDRRRDITFVKKELCLDCNSDDYDQVTSKIIKGEYGSAVVHYVSYRFAVVGEVDLHFGNEDVLDVYGTVNAHCVSNYKYGCPVSDCDKVYHSITLFSKNQNQPSQVESFGVVELSRPVLVVPAYASLLLEVDLWVYDTAGTFWGNYKDVARIDAKQLCHCTSEFDREVSDDDIEKMVEGCGLVEVLWGHADSLLAKSEYKNEEEDKGEREECKTEERAKRAKLCLPQQSMSASSDCRSPWSTKPMDYLILEVFSVFIGCFYHYDEPSRVYGVIEVHDKYGSSIIFERDEEHYEIYPCKGNAFQLNSVRSFTGASLSISANLKDNTQDYQISKGDLVWDKDNIQNEISWSDRPLCSVIRGDRGYAAIHYTILSSAVEAKVNMSLFANGSSRALSCLHGSVFAWYNTYQHSTDYEMAFYKLKLFQIDSENSLPVTSGVKIPLSRSLVSVPPNSSLIIGVNLAIVHRPSLVPCTVKISNPVTNDVEVLQKDPEFETDNSGVPPSLVPCAAKTSNSLTKDVETLQKDVGFEADNSGVSSQMIWGEYYRLEVSVEWSEVQESLA